MKYLLILCSIAFLACSCARQKVFCDDKLGSVSRVYKAVTFTSTETQHPVFKSILTFVRVEPNGEVIMKFSKGKEYEVRGMPWHDLNGTAELGLPLQVLATSSSGQWAQIEYEAWTAQPTM